MDIDDTWKNVFEKSTSNGLNVHFESLGKEFHELHWVFKEGHEIKFVLSSNQELEFNSFFKKQLYNRQNLRIKRNHQMINDEQFEQEIFNNRFDS
jgi:hypothetical protein